MADHAGLQKNVFLSTALPYLIAVLTTGVAIFVRVLLDPLLGQNFAFTTIYGAVGITARYAGFRPALLSVLVGYAICNVLFKTSGPLIFNTAMAVGFGAFILTCGIIIWLGVKARTANFLYRNKETERQQVEEELRNSERGTRSILESITESFLMLDEEWRFSYVNPAAERLVGKTSGQLISKLLWEEYPDLVGGEIEALYRRVVAKQAAESLTTFYQKHERWYELHVYPASKGLSVYFRDVTESRNAERALRASEERRRIALDSAELGAWNIDIATGKMTSDERFAVIYTGKTSPLSYEKAVDAIYPDDREQVLQAMAAAINSLSPAPYAEEYRVIHADSSIHWVYAKGRPNFEGKVAHKKLVSFDGTVSDITERKRAEELFFLQSVKLEEADRHKNEFLATLAHELRNPLAPMRNVVEIIKRKKFPDPQLNRSVEVFDRQLSHITHLVDDLLDVARITQNRVALRKTILSLNDVVTNAVDSIRHSIEAYNQVLIVKLPATPILLEADLTRLNQVVLNLLSNANKYTPEKGTIELTVTATENTAMLSVKDDGIGIADNQLSKIFEMFSQLAPALERAEGGLGIGLALVKGLVELHDGSIEAFSAGFGKGSEFVVKLPKVAAMLSQSLIQGDPELPGVKKRILMIDDNMDNADTMAQALELLGHEVKVAYDGLSGIDLGKDYKPDVILLDIGLPGMNGYETATLIRKSEWGKSIYLIAATGWGDAQDKLKAIEAGFDHHLTKPIDFEALENALGKAMAKKD